MSPSAAPGTVPLFFFLWILLGIVGVMFFAANRNAVLKRRLLPFVMAAFGTLLVLTALHLPGPAGADPQARGGGAAIVLVAAICLLNLRQVRFCDQCGRTNYRRNPLAPPVTCDECGSKLSTRLW